MRAHEHEAKENNRPHKQPDEEKIVEAIRKTRFGEKYKKLYCPYCGSSRVIRKGRIHHKPYLQRYHCKNCGNSLMTSRAQYSAEEK